MLWQVVLEESAQWKLWSQHTGLAILWHQGSVKEIETRLMQLKRQLHCRWTLLLPVDFKHWSQLQKQHAEAVAAGQLQLVQRPIRQRPAILVGHPSSLGCLDIQCALDPTPSLGSDPTTTHPRTPA